MNVEELDHHSGKCIYRLVFCPKMQCQRINGKVLLFNDVIDHLGIFHKREIIDYRLVIGKALVTEKSTATLYLESFKDHQFLWSNIFYIFMNWQHFILLMDCFHGIIRWGKKLLITQAIIGENSYFVALYPQLIKDLNMSLPLDHCLRLELMQSKDHWAKKRYWK